MPNYFGTDHLISPPITAGPSPSIWQSLTQGVSQQYHVDSSLGLYTEVINRYGNSIRAYENATGRSAMPTLGSSENTNLFVDDVQGRAPGWWYRNIFTGELSKTEQDKLNQFREVNAWVKAQNRPDLPSMEQVIADVARMQQGVEAETERQSETSTVGGTVARFAGGAIGSLTPRDPLNLATLSIGGFGKSVATRIATEAAVQAGITGITDVASVNPNRQAVGLPEHSTMYDMLLAAAGGAAFRGLGEAAHVGIKRFIGAAPEPEKLPDGGPTNEELHAAFDAMPDSPRTRAGRSILDAVDDIERVNPYGDSLNGHARFIEELRRVQDTLGGEPMTAIARFLPPLPEMPFEHIENNFDFQLVREQQPELYGKLQSARAAIADVEGRITDTEQSIANLAPSDAIARIDPNSGELIRLYEQELRDPALTTERRADIQRKVNTIVQSLGPENVQRELINASIKPKKELQSLRASRRAAVRRYKDAYNAVQTEADAIKNRQRIIALANNRKEVRAIMADKNRPFLVPSAQAAEDMAEVARVADEGMSERIDALVAKQPDDGTVDIGLEQPVPGDRFFLDEGGQKVTFAKAMADLTDDDRTAEAMRTCML